MASVVSVVDAAYIYIYIYIHIYTHTHFTMISNPENHHFLHHFNETVLGHLSVYIPKSMSIHIYIYVCLCVYACIFIYIYIHHIPHLWPIPSKQIVFPLTAVPPQSVLLMRNCFAFSSPNVELAHRFQRTDH